MMYVGQGHATDAVRVHFLLVASQENVCVVVDGVCGWKRALVL